MKSFLVAVMLALGFTAVSGCASFANSSEPEHASNSPNTPHILAEDLIKDGSLFGASASDLVLPDAEILAVDDDMRAFVRENAGYSRDSDAKLHHLLRGMITRGLLSLEYDPHITHTARETFHSYTGNCLSFTNLFVALAREAGLNVKFQMIDIPPAWLGDEKLVILNNHINVKVRTKQRKDYVVDFNIDDYRGNYPKRQVSDQYALALYYSNVAVQHLTQGDYGQSFAYLRKSIQEYPRIPGPWINLGVLYSRHGAYDEAEVAYRRALKLDRANKSALTNMASLYHLKGDEERAEYYTRRIRFYREKNPYYHYWLARQAVSRDDYDEALQLIGKAIRLKEDEHQFYYLQGLVRFKQGNNESAKVSFQKANKYVQFEEIKRKYSRKIAALDGISQDG